MSISFSCATCFLGSFKCSTTIYGSSDSLTEKSSNGYSSEKHARASSGTCNTVFHLVTRDLEEFFFGNFSWSLVSSVCIF